MNTLLLKFAVEVEQTRSISRAAKNLAMAQPNLSKAIKELEEDLGFAIFERSSRGVIPTSKGDVFFEYARSILAQLDSIQALSDSADGSRQKFGIAISRGSYISSAVVDFASGLDSSMGVDLDIRETSSMDVINNVIRGRYNLGIIRYRAMYGQYFNDFLTQHRITAETLWEFRYLAVMSRTHPLANEALLVPSDLAAYTEIVHGDTMIPYLSQEGGVNQHAEAPVKRQIRLYERCNQFELLTHMPTTFMWASPIPDDLLSRYGLVQRKCDFPNNDYKDLLICPQEYHLSALEKKFVGFLKDSIDALSEKRYR